MRKLDRLILPSKLVKNAFVRPSGANVGDRSAQIGIEPSRLLEIAPSLEVIRLGARLGLFSGGRTDPMRAIRQPFDQAAAKIVRDANILLGMPGASARMFETCGRAHRVLHQVDAHPRARNTILSDVYGSKARRELLPLALVERIERELALAEVVLVPSQGVAQQMKTAGLDSSKILTVPYGVDRDRFFAECTTTREPGKVRLLYVGQISYRKGLPFLLEAVKGQKVTLDLVGPRVAKELIDKLPDNVRYHPVVAHHQLRAMFNKADAFVLPSVEDAYGLVVGEALASGLPIITTTATGASEVLEAGDGHVVEPADTLQLRRAISETEPLPSLERLARAANVSGRVSAGRLNDWDRFTVEVLDGVSGAAKRRGA